MVTLVVTDILWSASPPIPWWRVCMDWIRQGFAVLTEGHVSSIESTDDIAVESDVSQTSFSIDPEEMEQFKELMLPFMDAAYNLARYLIRDESLAEDIVQDSYLRALKAFRQYRGGDAKSWLLAIVRNCCMTRISKNARSNEREMYGDDKLENIEWTPDHGRATPEQEYDLEQRVRIIRELIEALPVVLREVLIFRELEDLSYTQIANVMQIPVGTVMSRLARARTQLALACRERGLVLP